MTTTVETAAATGRVARVIGPVVDVEFPVDAMPEIYNALHVEVADPAEEGAKKTLTLEVAQHLGDGIVRAISMQPPTAWSARPPWWTPATASPCPSATSPRAACSTRWVRS